MADVNPYASPLETREPHLPVDAGRSRFGLLRWFFQGAVVGVLGSVPLAAVVALCFRFPIPFAGYRSGPSAIVPAMFAAIVYSLLGGAVVQAVFGGMGGMLAYALGRRGAANTNLLSVILGLVSAMPGLLLLAVLDWIIGPW